MRFRAVHKLMSYLLAGTAIATLMTSGAVPLPTLALLLVLGICSWFVEPGTWMGQLLDRAGLVFNVVALAFFGLSLFQVIESFPEPEFGPILNVVLFLLGYKLFHRRNNRDYLLVYILSFLLVLAAAWLAQTIFFVVGFVAYVVLATWTLILFHLRREIEDNYLVKHLPESGSEKVTAARVLNSRRVVGRSFFLATGGMALLVFLGAVLVFAVIPRVGIGFLSGTFRRRVNIVGFSDEVTLGHHGVLSGDNDTVVLWVRVPRIEAITRDDVRDRTISSLYWRGTIYDTYLNGQWLRSRQPETETLLEESTAADSGSIFWLRSHEAPLNQRRVMAERFLGTLDEQEIHVVGLSHPVAFALDEPMAFRMPPPAPGAFTMVRVEGRFGGEVALRLRRVADGGPGPTIKEFTGARYLAYSRQQMTRAPFGQGRAISELQAEGHLQSYLTVPRSLSPRVTELARSLTAGKPGPMAKAMAIVEWLQKTHKYTTDLKRDPSVPDPLEDFLFHETAGHCEYFASAEAVLLRLAGVPTRYVNGFLGGEWNDIGKYLTIRDNRAHSWVEAYLGPAGWVRLDATPSAGASSRMTKLRQLVDSVEFYWSRWVIDYDVSRQIDIAKKIGGGVGMNRNEVDLARWKRTGRWVGIALAVALILTVLGRWWRSRRRGERIGPRQVRRRRGGPLVFRLYDAATARLAKRGWTRASVETPREFVARLRALGVPGAEALGRLTEHYVAARFGEREIPSALLHELEPALAELGSAPAPSAAPPVEAPRPPPEAAA